MELKVNIFEIELLVNVNILLSFSNYPEKKWRLNYITLKLGIFTQ